MDHKKSKVSVLGPRGRRRLGRDVSFKDPGLERKGYIGGQAEVQKDLKRKGFGVFPEGFLDSCNVEPKASLHIFTVSNRVPILGTDFL